MMKLLTIFFSIFLSWAVFAQPSNDLCSNPEPIADLDGTCNSFSNVGATTTAPYTVACMGNNNVTWFSFVADGPNADITVSGINRPEIAIVGLNQTGGSDLCDINDVVSYGCINPNNNYTSVTLSITNNSLIPGETYLILVANNTGGGGGSGTFDLCIDNPVNTSPSTCANASPFCTADGDVVFDAGVDAGVAEPGNDYDCLLQQQNPAWFFLEIDTAGTIDLSFSSSPAEDIDYVSWGPFPDQATACDNLTTANLADCSFAAATSESLSLTGTQTGEVYMVMITNFSNNPTQITFSQTGGTATTNCAIVLPVSLTSFEVIAVDNSNELSWTTASETNNDYFIVEYSTDGKNWKGIQKVQGAGNSNSENTYLTTHRDFENEINYYRLKQVDYNGAINTHNIISIDNTKNRTLLKRVNSLGQEVGDGYKGVVFEYYSDGSTKKVMQ
jgi:hypothetical protein